MNKVNILNDNWKILKFKECIQQLNTGLNPRNNFTLGEGKIKYITAKNLTKLGTIDFSKCDFVSEEAKTIINKRSDIKIGDILFSSRAPIGHCHLIKEEPNYFDIGESIFSIRVNEEIVLPEYLCLYLSSDYFIKLASKNTTGSIIQEIRISDLMSTDIIVPPKDIQKYIAETLNSIDKKIELNNKISFELENMAKIIYDYWFLQFEFPNAEGKPYKSSGGKMVWNEELKKEIPDDWRSGKLNYFIEKVKNGDWGKEEREGNYILEVHCIRGTDIPAIFSSEELKAPKRYILQKNEDKILEIGDIIIEISGGSPTQSTGRICYINSNVLKRFSTQVITSNFCKCISLKNKENMYWFYSFWKKLYDSGVFFTYEGKTTGIKNLLFDSFCENYNIIIPNEKVLKKYYEKIKPLFDKIQKNSLENQELTSLRDYLLPLLMNGQVGFKD